MADKTIDLRALEQFVDRLETLPAAALPVLTEAMHEAVNVGLAAVIERTPVAYGNLRGSINTQVLVKEQVVLGVIGTNAPYALWVEEDTDPHWAPIAPLVDWVAKKQIAGVYSIKTRRRLGGRDQVQAQNMALARAVQKQIAKYGTTGQHMFRDGLAVSDDEINRIFARALEKIIAGLTKS
jgi:hypothetical protein